MHAPRETIFLGTAYTIATYSRVKDQYSADRYDRMATCILKKSFPLSLALSLGLPTCNIQTSKAISSFTYNAYTSGALKALFAIMEDQTKVGLCLICVQVGG